MEMERAEPSHRRPHLLSSPAAQPSRLYNSSALQLPALALCLFAFVAPQPSAANVLPQNLEFMSALAAHTYTPPRAGQYLQQQAQPAYQQPAYQPPVQPGIPAAQPAAAGYPAQPTAGVAMNPAMVPGGLPPNGQVPMGQLPAPRAEPAGPPLVTDEVQNCESQSFQSVPWTPNPGP
mmetsp:Transcript_26550/g.41561  ORF Transcript_26550/g.41561 Transcript_26550/m.41561 type:complete len:177 (+) Transcript_26550:392-922(+)